MARLGIFPVIVRELFSARSLPRVPEPSLVMDDAEQVAAYVTAGRIDGVMAAAYVFQTAQASAVIQGCRRVIDVGCGPATQLGQIAQLHPDVSFLAVDLSAEMLEQARRYVDGLGLRNVEFLQSDMTDLKAIATGSADGVISTMALHHLPTRDHLERCFAEIRRILKPQGALYLSDFARLKTHQAVHFVAHMNGTLQPPLFTEDYEHSLRAAFLLEDFAQLTKETLGDGYTLAAMWPVSFMMLVTSAPGDLEPERRAKVQRLRNELPPTFRSDLDLIRRLFRFGGLHDPFR